MAAISDIEVKRELRPCLVINGDTEKKSTIPYVGAKLTNSTA